MTNLKLGEHEATPEEKGESPEEQENTPPKEAVEGAKRKETPEERDERREKEIEEEKRERREEISKATQELKEEGMEVVLYKTREMGINSISRFYGLIGKINGHIIIMPRIFQWGEEPRGEVGGKKIHKDVIEDFQSYFRKVVNNFDRPPKDLQIAAMKYALRKDEERLEVLNQSMEAIQMTGASEWRFRGKEEKYGEMRESRRNDASKDVEARRKKLEAFEESKFDDIFDFEKDLMGESEKT